MQPSKTFDWIDRRSAIHLEKRSRISASGQKETDDTVSSERERTIVSVSLETIRNSVRLGRKLPINQSSALATGLIERTDAVVSVN